MYLVAKTVQKDSKEFIDIFPGKTEDYDLETLAHILLEEVDGEGEVHFYAAELDEIGRVETPVNGAPDPICGFRGTGTGELVYLLHSPFSGKFVSDFEYGYEERVYEGY